MTQPNPKLAAVKDMKGLSGPFLFAVDTMSFEGSKEWVCHFVRVETVKIKQDAALDITFNMLHEANDPRLVLLTECMKGKK